MLAYTESCTGLLLFPAGKMNAKSKIKIYSKILKEVCKEYEGAHEFISNKAKELYSQEGYLVRRYVYVFFNPLSANPKKWSNTIKQFVA